MSLRCKIMSSTLGLAAALLVLAVFSGGRAHTFADYCWYFLFCLLAVALSCAFVQSQILPRLRAMRGIADDISQKWQVSLRLPQEGRDEITDLSKSFNTLLETLEQLISDVPDSLILSDADGKILLANASTYELLALRPDGPEINADEAPDVKKENYRSLVGTSLASVLLEKEKTPGPGDLPKSVSDVFEGLVQRADMSLVPVEIHQHVMTLGPRKFTLSITRDLTDRKLMETRLVRMAFFDSNTGLPNRYYFLDELEKELRKTRADPCYTFCVVFMNMDHFKIINEQLGPQGADQVLVKVSERIEGMSACFASVFRVNGDEFGIILGGINSRDSVSTLLHRLQHVLHMPMLIDGKTVFPSTRYGVVLGISAAHTSAQVLSMGSDALLQGKKRGIGTITFVDADEGAAPHHQSYDLLTVRADMERGLSSSEFAAYFQPIYQIAPSRLAGFEALVRWLHPARGVLSPGEFIYPAERTGLITEIDKAIILQAIRAAKKWSGEFPDVPFFISANVSGASFKDPDLIPFILDNIRLEELDPGRIVLEITEGIFIEGLDAVTEKLNLLRQSGLKIALDDFGTGYSSLQYLSQLPINYIKIDKSFIDKIQLAEKHSLMVRSIISMASALGFDTVAEGVENESQVYWLTENKAGKIQGYFYSPPVPIGEAEHMMADAEIFASLGNA